MTRLLDLAATFLERENAGFTVDTATSTAEGLERLGADVDCIVSDYDMPDLNGIEFLEAVRSDYPDLPFILFTGKGSEEIASEAISAGVTDYLQKGTSGEQYTVLANRIGNAVDQFRSQTKLEASQQRLELFVEQSPLGVLEYDQDFEIVGLNPAGEEILGYTEDELKGETWEKIVTTSSHQNVDEVTSALAEAEGGYHSIDRNVRKDGEIITCEWHNRIITDESGDVVAIFSQFQDITDRKERQEQLQRTTARLRALFDNSPVMINIHDDAGNIIEPNPRLCEKTGYDKSELTEMKVWELDQGIDPEAANSLWEGMEVGTQREFEGAYERKDGSTLPVRVHVSRIAFEGKDRFVVISRDLTDERDRQRELERYEAMVENTEDGIYLFDESGNVRFVNERVVDVSGIPFDGWVGEHVSVQRDLGTLTESELEDVESAIEAIAAATRRTFESNSIRTSPTVSTRWSFD
ncbi:PAS domain S-box protein [Halomicroarcula sp. GCM10025710]